MRFALWLLAIFAAAVGVALFATRSTGTVTLFWPPYRIDLSLNLVLLLLTASRYLPSMTSVITTAADSK